VNHKKIYRMRKELGLLRKYRKHTKHARKRPKNHEVSERNKYWEADIKFISTEKDGYVPMIDTIQELTEEIKNIIANSFDNGISGCKESIEK
ncbi:MAG TPA: hypothetical protein PK584_07070, partial [Fervidobacterium sp.]|nr:hypothetical protein [Fervidobacterium sp.]